MEFLCPAFACYDKHVFIFCAHVNQLCLTGRVFLQHCTWQEVASSVLFLIGIWMVKRGKLGNEIRNSN